MAEKHGSLSINSENIFPIIKKWLYSDHDIFYRELISNGCDAITKLKKLDMMGEYELPENYKARIDVVVDPEAKTLSFTDNGIGMTADEVEEYINQIAFSGATDFISKYKDKTDNDQIIGHFGLGFYSAFMVADEVHIDTLSYKEGAKAVHWECDGGTEFTMTEGDKAEVGTKITLFVNEDVLEFCNEYKAREVITPYLSTVLYNMLGNRLPKEDIEEILSDVFVTLWKNADTIDLEKGTLRAYLAAVARNFALKKLNKQRDYTSLDEIELPDEAAVLEENTADSVVWDAVMSLGEPDNEIFVRYYKFGEKIREIAKATGVNPSTVKTKLSRGKRKLKEILLHAEGLL